MSSRIAIICICTILILGNLVVHPGNILTWDFFGYYLYLPFTFIYHDLGLSHREPLFHIIDTYHNTTSLYQAYPSPNGLWVMKYSMGIAILNIPFFLLGHLYALCFGYIADGFSAPYQNAVLAGAIFYSITGIFFLRRILKLFFSEQVVITVMILVLFGTNIFFNDFLIGAGTGSHNYLFALYAVIIWLTIQYHREYKARHLFFLSVAMALAILCRPSEMVCILIPVLWGIKDKETFSEKINFAKKNRSQILKAVLVFVLVLLPQFLYWKHYTGQFFFYSYSGNRGEGFEFFHPFIWKVLFSFRKGWYIYTPMMLFATFGFYYLYKKNTALFVPLFIYFVANLYFVSCWSSWWFTQSFGCRALMQSYVVMSIPLGFLITYVHTRKLFIRSLFYCCFTILLTLNLFQSW